MKHVLLSLLAVVATVAALGVSTSPASAQVPTWSRGYPEMGAEGCTWYVAQWSDTSYTKVPWNCPEGTVPNRLDKPVPAERGYPEMGAEGCVWYVAKWSDGVWTKVPFECPDGFVLDKPDAPPISSQPTAPPAGQSRLVDDPSAYMARDVSYARVPTTTAIYQNPGNTEVARYGGPNFWVTTTGETSGSYTRVSWSWGSSGWIASSALVYDSTLSRLQGVPMAPGEWKAILHNDLLNVRGAPSTASPIVGELRKYDAVPILEEVTGDDGAMWFRIGDGRYVHSNFIRAIRPVARPAGVGPNEKWIEVNLSEQVMIAHEGDRPVYATLVATGREGLETTTGSYRIYAKYTTAPMQWLEADPPYSLADVPWVQYFNGDQGFHTSYWHDGYGYVRSAGCVNLSPADAKWLFEWAGPQPGPNRETTPGGGNPGTLVWVHH